MRDHSDPAVKTALDRPPPDHQGHIIVIGMAVTDKQDIQWLSLFHLYDSPSVEGSRFSPSTSVQFSIKPFFGGISADSLIPDAPLHEYVTGTV